MCNRIDTYIAPGLMSLGFESEDLSIPAREATTTSFYPSLPFYILPFASVADVAAANPSWRLALLVVVRARFAGYSINKR